MTEEKLKITFASAKSKRFIEFGDYQVIVNPNLEITDKVAFIDAYIQILYLQDENSLAYHYQTAECALIVQFLDTYTNIDIEDLNLDGVINSGLWNMVKSAIPGYESFRQDLKNAIDLHQKQLALEKSVGYVLEGLIDKAMAAIDKISSMDVESLKQVSEQFAQKLDELNQTAPGIVSGKPVSRKRTKKAE